MANYKKMKKPFKKFRKGGKYYKKGGGKLKVYENKNKIGGFPDTYFTPLTYNNAAFAIGGGSSVGYVLAFAATDPTKNNSITPQGWTQLKAIYDVFLVHMIKVKITFYNKQSVPAKVFISMVDQDSNTLATGAVTSNQANNLSTQTYSKIRHMSASGGGKDCVTVSFIMKIAKFAGKRKLTPADERNLGNTGSSISAQTFAQPTYIPKICYGAVNVDGSSISLNGIYAEEQITWYTQFLERLQIS